MNTRLTRNRIATRIATLFASAAATTLILGSQLGLAEHYVSKADAMLAARPAAPLVQNAVGAAPTRRST